MITYLFIGTVWTMFVDYVLRPKFNGAEMTWFIRIFNILLWPLNIILFIIGFLFGVGGGKKD